MVKKEKMTSKCHSTTGIIVISTSFKSSFWLFKMQKMSSQCLSKLEKSLYWIHQSRILGWYRGRKLVETGVADATGLLTFLARTLLHLQNTAVVNTSKWNLGDRTNQLSRSGTLWSEHDMWVEAYQQQTDAVMAYVLLKHSECIVFTYCDCVVYIVSSNIRTYPAILVTPTWYDDATRRHHNATRR